MTALFVNGSSTTIVTVLDHNPVLTEETGLACREIRLPNGEEISVYESALFCPNPRHGTPCPAFCPACLDECYED